MKLVQAVGRNVAHTLVKLALASCALVVIAIVIGRGIATILIETSNRV